jgi:hypothetical protein
MIEFGILVAYVAIIVMAMVPIWIGSHQSLEQKMVPKPWLHPQIRMAPIAMNEMS